MLASSQLRSVACRHHSCRGSRPSRVSTVQCAAAARSSSSSTSLLTPLAAAAAAAVLQLSAANMGSAAPLYDFMPGFGGESQNPFYQAVQKEMQQQQPQVEDLFDEYLMTDELRSFVDKVMGGKLKPEEYEVERRKVNFRRDLDGRVSLRSRQGEWFSVRPDYQVPGFLLLQDQNGGVYFLPPSDMDTLAQFDLSDDIVVAELFSNTAWQDVMAPFSMRATDGSIQQLRLSEQDFRLVDSLVEDAEEPEVPEEEEAGQQQQQQQPATAR